MPQLNLKYVELLQKSYEKYKNINILKSDTKKEHNEDATGQVTISKKSREILHDRKEICRNSRITKLQKVKRTNRPKVVCNKPRSFLEHEDELIFKAIRKSSKDSKINIPKLCKILHRNHASVEQRIKKLMLTGVSKMNSKRFSLEEDMIIIDTVLDKFEKSDKSLEDVVKFPSDIIELGSLLQRTHQSVFERWKAILLSTLLGHYRKSLNLDVKSMLANFLLDNFTSNSCIDWNLVLKQPEFSGQTELMIKKVYHRLVYKASKQYSVDKMEVTLEQIAEHANNDNSVKRFNDRMRKRQIDIVEYFENSCKRRKLKTIVW